MWQLIELKSSEQFDFERKKKSRVLAGGWFTSHGFLASDGKSWNIPAQSASGEKGKLGRGECEPGLCQAADFTVALAHFSRARWLDLPLNSEILAS